MCGHVQLDQSKNNRAQGNYLKGEEAAVVQQVTKIGEAVSGKKRHTACQRANITFRLNRNPVIGDKFASRAGQVFSCSLLPANNAHKGSAAALLPVTQCAGVAERCSRAAVA